jgi:murein DD-endopeptidase MepM/ murein hydrolase activator NlpD
MAKRIQRSIWISLLVWVGTLFLTSGLSANPKQVEVSPWNCQKGICQRSHTRGEYVTLQVKSKRKEPVWLVLEPEDLRNLKPLQPTPFVTRLTPGKAQDLGVLAVQNKRQPHRYTTRWEALRGNPNAVHDDRWHYRMPFGGNRPIPISQGYNGRFSHKGLSAYSLDFPMPWGTPILASRGGVITEVINDMVASGTRKGEFESDNRVIIEHRDGTFAVYAHLRHGGPARVGQVVRSGELIGLSGDTGFSTGPHLHFQVHKLRRDGRRQTLPVKFFNGTSRGFTPVAGLVYKPGCPRDGGSQCMPGELADEGSPRRSSSPAAAAPRGPDAPSPRKAAHQRLDNGACQCANGAVLHVDLPCSMVCGK